LALSAEGYVLLKASHSWCVSGVVVSDVVWKRRVTGLFAALREISDDSWGSSSVHN